MIDPIDVVKRYVAKTEPIGKLYATEERDGYYRVVLAGTDDTVLMVPAVVYRAKTLARTVAWLFNNARRLVDAACDVAVWHAQAEEFRDTIARLKQDQERLTAAIVDVATIPKEIDEAMRSERAAIVNALREEADEHEEGGMKEEADLLRALAEKYMRGEHWK